MNTTTILMIALLTLTQANIIFDISKRCACSELLQADCTSAVGFCSWSASSTTCSDVTLSCANYPQAQCTAKGSVYRCEWANNACSDKTYSCTDFTTGDTCPNNKAQNCYWNAGSKCEAFSSCDKYDTTNCPRDQECSTSSGSCAAQTYVTCTTFTTQATCKGADTATSQCSWTTAGACKSLLSNVGTCTDWNDFQSFCENQPCKYANNTCGYQSCADRTTEANCSSARTGATEMTLCSWASSACVPATDTSALTAATCVSQSAYNYYWGSDNKCNACTNLVSWDSASFSALPVFLVATILIFA